MLSLIAALAFSAPQLPPLPPIRREPQIAYLDRSGVLLGVRGGRYGPPVDVARLPSYVPAAFVAIEDRRFYSHAGFDPVGMARAIVT
ncbi:MAG: transglycosylase domain-containing protein, partial [Caulobacteraceae bacterium]|nr:transglycosylase domain-containing protein [Caulobacteraceae bacterium]